jgi:hypothetical protein
LKIIDKIDKSMANLTKMRREKTQISKIRNGKGTMAWEVMDQVSFAVCGSPTDKPGPEQHSPLDRPTPTWGKKEKLSNKQ